MPRIQRREFCQGVAALVALPAVATEAAEAAEPPVEKIGRPVRIVSLSFQNKPLEAIAPLVDTEGRRGADLIALPEMWQGTTEAPERLDGRAVRAMADLARRHRTYVVCPIYREAEGRRLNTAVLIDREGRVARSYDKAYPYWSEFDHVQPPTAPGAEVMVHAADFGRVGMAICFDVNFPEVWQMLADQGAELVVWPSAYSAGSSLQAHAVNHHYAVVSSTWTRDCLVYDITGEKIHDQATPDLNVSRITLDLDRGIYHENFNIDKRNRLLKERPGDVLQKQYLPREQWFVLKSKRPGVSARALAKEYGLEELRDYKTRSRKAIDKMRGRGLG
jgi:predicted amidohydrolase